MKFKDNGEVAHAWAHRNSASGQGSHFYFEGDTIYSYGSHFPIARHYKGVVLFTTAGYSVTTSRHIGITRYAVNHLTVFNVADPTSNPGAKDVKNYKSEIERLGLLAARAKNPADALERLKSQVDEANRFCAHFGFKTRFSIPDDATLAVLKERAKKSAERERKAKAAREAKALVDAQEAIGKWLSGESVQIPYSIDRVYLRAIDGEMQTSKNARVPLAEAQKAFRFATLMRAKGWHRNGEQFSVGQYQLDAVNESGVIAGCHRVSWDEIERFAASQNWI